MTISIPLLRSFVGGRWVEGAGETAILLNPATEAALARAGAGGINWAEALDHSRTVGGPGLRELTFAQRGEMLRALSRLIHAHRDELIALATANGGNTRGDAKFDIDGASGTLASYADLGAGLGEARFLRDGEGVQLTRSVRFFGQHISVPREGVAVHINAFNFPAWGLAEKAAVALLAGMPVVVKPATATAMVAHRLAELFVEAKLLPAGAFSFVAGSVGDLLSHLGGQDVLAFTGSGRTGAELRRLERLVARSVRVNVEADSLNAAVLGPDAGAAGEAYDLFIADVVRDMTQKTGQKCTAIRRVLVPEETLEAARNTLGERLGAVRVGNPAQEDVTMGPVATRSQLEDVRAGIRRLEAESSAVFGGSGDVEAVGVERGKGFFVGPVLLQARDPAASQAVHEHEVFGPVATLLPYSGRAADAVGLVRRGGGGLVASVYSDDRGFLREMVLGLAPYHGRIFLGSGKLSGHAVGPGTVLPQLVHGGPGRAGGGEELGGTRGLAFYLQRTAVSGDKPVLESLFSTPTRDG